MSVEIAFNGFPITDTPKYDPAISVATPEPINDRFIGVSVNISIKKNATDSNNAIEIEMIYFFIAKLECIRMKIQ